MSPLVALAQHEEIKPLPSQLSSSQKSIPPSGALNLQKATTFTSVDVKVVECKIPFKVNRWDVDVAKLKICFGNLEGSKIQSFDIYATSSPDGKFDLNTKLAYNRQRAIADQLNKLFPDVKVNSKSGGENRFFMRNALVVAVLRFSEVLVVPPPKPKPCPVCQVPKPCPVYRPPPKPLPEKYGWAIWGGIESIIVSSPLSNYTENPFLGGVIGVRKNIRALNNVSNIYMSTIFDLATSDYNHGLDANGNKVSMVYFFMNIQGLVGVEGKLWKDHFSGYVDGGLAFQQRNFLINSVSANGSQYNFTSTLGLTTNAGLIYYYNYNRLTSYFMKLNLNAMVGVPQADKVYGEEVDINPITIAPSISIGVDF